jgi:organic hydroperoxide reductase OsmC/OhrA
MEHETGEYRVELIGTDLKSGGLTSPDGLPLLLVSSPPQFGGPGGTWSPEHLFVAAIASCLMTTFRSIAESSGVEVIDYSDSASGSLVRGEDRLYRVSEITLRPRVVISDSTKSDHVRRLLDKAERVCLIGRSVNSTVRLEPQVLVVEPV